MLGFALKSSGLYDCMKVESNFDQFEWQELREKRA